MDELTAGLDHLRAAPSELGVLRQVVRRPVEDEREVLEVGRLDPAHGLLGDNWRERPSSRTPDRSPHPDCQLNVMSARAIELVAGEEANWRWAGDQLFIDLDLSHENLPAGTRLQIGAAVIEVTAQPHTGCAKFARRFGADALRFVNSVEGKALRLRGLNARVVVAGEVRPGDLVCRLAAAEAGYPVRAMQITA
jgi:hypothetical protein